MSRGRHTKSKAKPLGKNLARRNQPVVPVGAWVELAAPSQIGDHEVFVSAQIEEERICSRQREKEARLERFQEDVRRRVREAHQRRREQHLQESSRAVNLQQRILQRSGRGGHKSEIYREGPIQITSDHEEPCGPQEESFDPDHLVRLSREIGGLVKTAKRALASRRVMAEKSDLPGGMWGQSFTRDPLGPQELRDQSLPQTSIISNDASSGNPGTSGDPETLGSPDNLGAPDDLSGVYTAGSSQARPPTQDRNSKSVTFDPGLGCLDTDSGQGDRLRANVPGQRYSGKSLGLRTERSGGEDARRFDAMDLRPLAAEEERRRRIGEEVSAYRRLYMDMERQAVQEKRRKKQHSRHIQRLKKAKEEERLAVERRSEAASEPTDPTTGLTREELIEDRRQQELRVEAEMDRVQRREKRFKEEERYIQALRAQMREKVNSLGIVLPPLCPCGVTAWDSNPDTCANNCIFYRNPKAYAKALASLLNSSEFG